MCGIAGIWYTYPNAGGRNMIKNMTDVIYHRGPDGEGFWVSSDETLLLGHRRLSIIDLSVNGHQPMVYNKYTITYNGEIYNFIELKKILFDKGYRFSNETDTEVIMAAYDFWGVKCLNHFDGMFAFCIYDKEKEEIFCARDRFGEKPFHYGVNEKQLVFGSEMKSLWEAGMERSIDDYLMYLFLNFGLHEDPKDKTRTFFKHIKRLKPGHYFLFKKGQKIKQIRYWKINTEINTQISFEEACLRFRELFFKSIQRRLRADVSIGNSLSGGLDSSSIALAINHINKNITQKSFSARFEDSLLDEGFFMKKVIENTNIEHFVTYPNLIDMIGNLEKITYHQEEPFSGPSVFAQWDVFRLAKQNNIKVLIDGQGADEVFAGYNHFFTPFFREIYLKKGKKALAKTYEDFKINNIISNDRGISAPFFLETKLPKVFNIMRDVKRKVNGVSSSIDIHSELYSSYKNVESPFNTFLDLNSSLLHYTSTSGLDKLLRFADRNSMSHSLEVRLPFLSHELVDFAFSLPSEFKIKNGWTKALIRYGLKDILPSEVAWRKNKLGFQPPQKEWETQPSFIEKAKHYQEIAIEHKYIKPGANLSWNSLVTGVFLDMTK